MTETSARFALPLLQAGQAQKELFHNEAVVRIDALLHLAVDSMGLNNPPDAPMAGQAWIIGTAPTGAWAGEPGHIAVWTSGGWRFLTPAVGMTAWLADVERWAWHDGAAWRAGPLPTGGIAVDDVQVVGAQGPAIAAPTGGSVIDSEARATLASLLSAMRAHGLIAT